MRNPFYGPKLAPLPYIEAHLDPFIHIEAPSIPMNYGISGAVSAQLENENHRGNLCRSIIKYSYF